MRTLGSWCGTRMTSSSCADAKTQAEEARRRLGEILNRLRLKLHPTKTRTGGAGTGQGGLQVPGLLPADRAVPLQGTGLSVPLAVTPGDERHPRPHPRPHDAATLGGDEGHPRGDPGTEPGAAWMGQLLPDGQRLGEVPADRQLRAAAPHCAPAAPAVAKRRARFDAKAWPIRASSTTTACISCSARFAILEARMQHEKTIGKPCAGNPHVRFERGPQETEPQGHRA